MNTKRYGLTIIVTLITLISIILTGCQPTEVIVTKEVEVPVEVEVEKIVEVTAAAEPTEAVEEVELNHVRVAIAIHGLTNDGSFSQVAYMGAKKIGALPNVDKLTFTENVDTPDIMGVLRAWVEEDYDIIWSHSGAIGWAAQELAVEVPDKTFVSLGDATWERTPNLCILEINHEEGHFLAGAMAGLLTETNKIAYQNGEGFPTYAAAALNFEMGAKYTNPDVESITVWTGDFNDPTKGRDSAEGLIEQGVDIIFTGLDVGKFGTIQAAQAAGIRLMGDHLDQKLILGVDNFITSVTLDYERMMPELIAALQRGETCDWVFENIKGDLANGAVDLSPTYGDVPEDVLARVDEIKQGLLSGEIDYLSISEYIATLEE